MPVSGLTSQPNIVVVVRLVDGVELSSNIELLGSVIKVANGRVLGVSTENLLGLLDPTISQYMPNIIIQQNLLVRFVDIIDSNNGQVAVVTEIPESDASASLDAELVNLGLRNVQSNGDREKETVGEADVLDNSMLRLAFA